MRPPRPRTCLALGALLGLLAAAGCSEGDDVPTAQPSDTASPSSPSAGSSAPFSPSEPSGASTPSGTPDPDTRTAAPADQPEQIATDDLATGLQAPWGIGFLPDGTTIVTERDSGRVLAAPSSAAEDDGSLDFEGIGVLDDTAAEGEAGLLGVAVSPTFRRDRLLYFYLTTAEDNRVVRATYDAGRLGPQQVVLDGIPRGYIHDGGRLIFGPDGYLYVSTGETGEQDLAQDRDSLGGKILRITPDGDAAPGNPFGDSPVWSWGHRNVQGLAFDDAGRMWASEFGDSTFDELNLIVKGGNYGWPDVEGADPNGEFIDPYAVWSTEEASPSGLAYADGNLYLASLRGERLWRIPVRGGDDPSVTPTIGAPVDAFPGEFGRLRTVTVAPDGRLWLMTSNTDGRGDPADGDDRVLALDLG